LFSLSRDKWTLDRLARRRLLFAAFSMHEVILIRALGLPAIVVSGLDRLDIKGLKSLAVLLNDEPSASHGAGGQPRTEPGSAAGDRQQPITPKPQPERSRANMLPLSCQLVILGWSLHDLSNHVPGGITSIARHLTQARDMLHVDFDCGVWRPTQFELKELQFASKVGDHSRIVKLFANADGFFDLEAFTDPIKVRSGKFTHLDEREELAKNGNVQELWEILNRGPELVDPKEIFKLLLRAIDIRSRQAPAEFSSEMFARMAGFTSYLVFRAHYFARNIMSTDDSHIGDRPGGSESAELLEQVIPRTSGPTTPRSRPRGRTSERSQALGASPAKEDSKRACGASTCPQIAKL
jgi:hypothetical protein